MLAGLLSRLRRVELHARSKRSGEKLPDPALLEELCEFERRWLKRLSYDDMVYYSMPFHEDEAEEALGEEAGEFLRYAPLWREVVFEHGVDSVCQLLEKLRKEPRVKANATLLEGRAS